MKYNTVFEFEHPPEKHDMHTACTHMITSDIKTHREHCVCTIMTLLCALIWFYAYKCHICLPISAHGLWEWLMILTLFAQLTCTTLDSGTLLLCVF